MSNPTKEENRGSTPAPAPADRASRHRRRSGDVHRRDGICRPDRALLQRIRRRIEQQQGTRDLQRHRGARDAYRGIRRPDLRQRKPDGNGDDPVDRIDPERRCVRTRPQHGRRSCPHGRRSDDDELPLQRERRRGAPQRRDNRRRDRADRHRPGRRMGNRRHEHAGQDAAPEGRRSGGRSQRRGRVRSRLPVGRLPDRHVRRPGELTHCRAAAVAVEAEAVGAVARTQLPRPTPTRRASTRMPLRP